MLTMSMTMYMANKKSNINNVEKVRNVYALIAETIFQ